MILAAILLLLVAVGLVPLAVGVPVAAGSLTIAGLTGFFLQRRLQRIPEVNGAALLVGRIGTVAEVDDRGAMITVGNELWRARNTSGRLLLGDRVRIDGLDGLVVRVTSVLDGGGQ